MNRDTVFAVIVVSLVFVVVRSSPSEHWIFVHYHKTGHDLARKLSQVFSGPPCNANINFHMERRVDIRKHSTVLREANIAVLAAPDILASWDEDILGQSNANVKFVHFVRDPFDMVMSGFLYHAQEVSPALEKWLKLPEFDPCTYDHHALLDVYGKAIGNSIGDIKHISKLIADIYVMCHALNNRKENVRSGYNQRLRSMSREDGVLLEAARSILSKSGGDILRMAANALYEQPSVGVSSIRIFLPEFSVGNKTQFVVASSRLFTFLMKNSSNEQTRSVGNGYKASAYFWLCLTEQEAIDKSVERAFVTLSTADTRVESHVTQGVLSMAEKSALRNHLMSHPSIGPLLKIVQDILNRK